jgi:hypothetical protein
MDALITQLRPLARAASAEEATTAAAAALEVLLLQPVDGVSASRAGKKLHATGAVPLADAIAAVYAEAARTNTPPDALALSVSGGAAMDAIAAAYSVEVAQSLRERTLKQRLLGVGARPPVISGVDAVLMHHIGDRAAPLEAEGETQRPRSFPVIALTLKTGEGAVEGDVQFQCTVEQAQVLLEQLRDACGAGERLHRRATE